MKKCPQCSTVYGDDIQFCLNDGTPLIAENFSLPSADDGIEAETVIRHAPIVVDVSGEDFSPAPESFPQIAPPKTIVVEKPASSRNYAIFLLVGLLLGGSLVLLTLFLARNFYRDDATQVSVNNNRSGAVNQAQNVRENPRNKIEAENDRHQTQTNDDDAEFNGRVIALNAYVRSAPDLSASKSDVLPVSDRINIEQRENDNSPWFYISCEHGTSGWMHGNTIEFTDGD